MTRGTLEPLATPTLDAGSGALDVVSDWTAPKLETLDQELLVTTDLATGSKEFSGVTVNEDRDRLLIVDDEDLLFEFNLAPDGAPVTPPRRIITISAGSGDIEGVAWIADTTYVLAHETDGQLTVVTINEDATRITNADVLRTVDTGVPGDNGKGIEGVAYLNQAARGASSIEFVVVRERPATLLFIDLDGEIVSAVALELPDASGVWATSHDHVTVVGDEGRVAVELEVGDGGAVAVLGELNLQLSGGRFEQPEGIAWSRNPDRLYIVGEKPDSMRFSLGSWRAPAET